jgi:tRNA 2-selenouridine synthase
MSYNANSYPLENALIRFNEVLLIDARSESEFEKAHIPGAINIPLLNNEQRKLIGTCYKQKGKQQAILLGFKLVGPEFYLKAEEVLEKACGRDVIVYCWRGGMRSNISAWIYKMSGLNSFVIEGGYKGYRNFVSNVFSQTFKLKLLTGYTGSNKTKILNELESIGENVIDLEKLACHRGSVFGSLGCENQPSVEHFENLLATELIQKKHNYIWIESENRAIGKVAVPEGLFAQMQLAPQFEIFYTKESRINHILNDYGKFPAYELIDKTKMLEKRLGNLRMKQAIEAIQSNDLIKWISMVLEYYDKSYNHWKLSRKNNKLTKILAEGLTPFQLAVKLKDEY